MEAITLLFNLEYYQRIAEEYQIPLRLVGELGRSYASRVASFLLERGLPPHPSFLEMGSSDGFFAHLFLKELEKKRKVREYVCLDFSLDSLRKSLKYRSSFLNVCAEASTLSGTHLCFRDKQFDVILMNELLDDLPAWEVEEKNGRKWVTVLKNDEQRGFEFVELPIEDIGIREKEELERYEKEIFPETKVFYLGISRVLKEVNRVLKDEGFLFIMDYFKEDPCIWALDKHHPIANITTPLHRDSLYKILKRSGFSILYWKSVWKFFEESDEGKEERYVWGEGNVPLWKILRDHITFPVEYEVILAKKE